MYAKQNENKIENKKERNYHIPSISRKKKCCLVLTRLSVLNFCFPTSTESEILRQETKREQT